MPEPDSLSISGGMTPRELMEPARMSRVFRLQLDEGTGCLSHASESMPTDTVMGKIRNPSHTIPQHLPLAVAFRLLSSHHLFNLSLGILLKVFGRRSVIVILLLM